MATAASFGTMSAVNAAATDTTILAGNPARMGATIYNDSTATLYLLFGAGTSSTSVYSVQMPPNSFYELPVLNGGVYGGIIKGIWSAANGAARITEFS